MSQQLLQKSHLKSHFVCDLRYSYSIFKMQNKGIFYSSERVGSLPLCFYGPHYLFYLSKYKMLKQYLHLNILQTYLKEFIKLESIVLSKDGSFVL